MKWVNRGDDAKPVAFLISSWRDPELLSAPRANSGRSETVMRSAVRWVDLFRNITSLPVLIRGMGPASPRRALSLS